MLGFAVYVVFLALPLAGIAFTVIWLIGRDVSGALGVAVLDFALLSGLPGAALLIESSRDNPAPGAEPIPGLLAAFAFILAGVMAVLVTVAMAAASTKPSGERQNSRS
ncbi:MAG: hypothetical protein Kow0010_03190 [Dehalococcoidia bacterium]